MSRPELTGHASNFYNEREARKYNSSSRMINVQREITLRAIELLLLPPDEASLVLDIGCGSGLSGEVLEEHGHVWVGCDVSRDMLQVAHERMEKSYRMKGDEDKTEADIARMKYDDDDDEDSDDDDNNVCSTGDLMHHDMGTGLPFRPATFDACVSISALQWLCYSNSSAQIPKRRLIRFFSSLYSILKKSARAVLQFYPETAEQAVLISECATAVGFGGGIVVDYPNSAKAKKHYLVLSCDRVGGRGQVPGMTAAGAVADQKQSQVQVGKQRQEKDGRKARPIRKKKGVKTKEWIVHKKETQRKKGKDVRPDTKYTARRRPRKF
ncbi:MAG: 18S rRNA (guanine1575-N7)-methyltransferase [Bacillariaceae sp.]|jgi:18S rRNA (guanine1575-N7)-methyltransferase